MKFEFTNNFQLKMIEKIIDDIISEIRKEGRLEDSSIGIQNINITRNGYRCNINCSINLSEDIPRPSTLDCNFNIKSNLFQTIPIYEVEGKCNYCGFLFKDFCGKIKVLVNKVSKDHLELTLMWLNINKTINKTYEVRDKEFIEVSVYSDDESAKEKGSMYSIGKKENN